MVIPIVFWCVKYLAFWIQIFDSSLMRIVTVNWFIQYCFWSGLRLLIFMMNCLNIVSLIVQSCWMISWSASCSYDLCRPLNKYWFMHKSRIVSLSYLRALTVLTAGMAKIHFFVWLSRPKIFIRKINFIQTIFYIIQAWIV